MKKKSRQGAALVYVITVTAVLMILVTGLVFLAGINLHSSQTSLAARQAYLDAKSAVEYGRAYVSLYAQQEKQQAENGMTLKWIASAGGADVYNINQKAAVTAAQTGNLPAQFGIYIGNSQAASFSRDATKDPAMLSSGPAVSDCDIGSLQASVPYHYKGITQSDGAAANRVYKMNFRFQQPFFTQVVHQKPKPETTAAKINGFLLPGSNYGAHTVIPNINSNSPYITPNAYSVYPVVVWNMMQGPNNLDEQTRQQCSLTAPEVYLMCKPKSLAYYDTSYGRLVTDFVCFNGNVSGQDYRANPTSNAHESKFLLQSRTVGQRGVICFANDCTVTVDGNQLKRTFTIPKGYYYFKDGMNLYDLHSDLRDFNGNQLLEPVAEEKLPASVSSTRVETIQDCYDSKDNNYPRGLIQGNAEMQNSTWNLCAYWADSYGNLSGGLPSSNYNGHKGELSNVSAFLYVASSRSWGNAFSDTMVDDANWKNFHFTLKDFGLSTGWSNAEQEARKKFGVYRAKDIFMEYVNSTEGLIVPAGSTIVLQANSMWFNSTRTDGTLGGGLPLTAGDAGSKLYLTSLNFQDAVSLTVPADLQVNYAGTTYTIRAGTYSVANKLNLFSDEAKAFFAQHQEENKSSSSESGGGTESGSTSSAEKVNTEGSGYYTQG